jgi:hypothetical protein
MPTADADVRLLRCDNQAATSLIGSVPHLAEDVAAFVPVFPSRNTLERGELEKGCNSSCGVCTRQPPAMADEARLCSVGRASIGASITQSSLVREPC